MTLNLSQVQIGFPTRNRWNDVKNTLQKLADFGLRDLRIVIADDASEQSCPFDVTQICPQAELRRFNEAKGATTRRNWIAREMDSKYYLGLDDDSFPVSGSLEAAIQFADNCSDFFSTSFPIYNPHSDKYQVKSLQKQPYRVQTFVGAGHLMDRQRFLELGGYREELVYYTEESELCARAFLRNWYCYHYSQLGIHHLSSSSWRNLHRQDFYGARNAVLWTDWFVPDKMKPLKHTRSLASRVLQTITTRRLGQIKGYFAGLKAIQRYKVYRQTMSYLEYQEWGSLPTS